MAAYDEWTPFTECYGAALRVSSAPDEQKATELFEEVFGKPPRNLYREWMRFGRAPDEYGFDAEVLYYSPAKPGRGAWEVWIAD